MKKTNKIFDVVKSRLDPSISINTFMVKLCGDSNKPGSTGSVSWYDDERLTYAQNVEEDRAIKRWLTDFISRMIVGYRIEIIDLKDQDGLRTMWYRRYKKKTVVRIPKKKVKK